MKTFKDVNGKTTKLGELVSVVGYGSETLTGIYKVIEITRRRRYVEVMLHDNVRDKYIYSKTKEVENEM